MKAAILFLFSILFFEISTFSQIISESFELRYFSDNHKANGETDFKGETAVFSTDERVEYLRNYVKVDKDFFNDPGLDTQVVSDEQLNQAMCKLKPQPRPEIRKRIPLESWKCMGNRPGMEQHKIDRLNVWQTNMAVEIKNEQLRFIEDDRVSIPVDKLQWRFLIEWTISGNIAESGFMLSRDGISVASLSLKGDEVFIHFKSEVVKNPLKKNSVGGSMNIKLEVDLENGRYNVYIDDQLVADFIPLLSIGPVDQFIFYGKQGLILDDVRGVNYEKAKFTADKNSRDIPYSIHTFIDQDFALKPNMEKWQYPECDDSQWPVTKLPYAHGGERFAGEDLYMRTTFTPDDYEKAFLNFETLDPGGEIWINGQLVLVQHHRHSGKLDVSCFLIRGKKNVVAVKIYPNHEEHTNRHTAADIHTGWFSGRMHIDLTNQRYIQDVFTYTDTLSDHSAHQKIRIKLINEDWEFEEREMKMTREFSGRLSIDYYPWYPEESSISVASKEIPVYLRLMKNEQINTEFRVNAPELWTPERPFLYKVVVTLYNERDEAIDDYIFTTGIRTVSQEGGTLRINGKPSMMNGALLFGYKYPLDKIAQWLRAAPEDKIEPVLMHLGNATELNLLVTIKNLEGDIVEQKEYNNIQLSEGRTSIVLESFRPKVREDYYVLHYQIIGNI